jgi:hypothetical protein
VGISANQNRLAPLLLLCLGILASLPVAAEPVTAEIAGPCADSSPLRRAYFGDIHVHTSYSLDAATRFGARATPNEAYAFARGESIHLPPYDNKGKATRSLRLSRPLDFAAVTDHAENLDFVRICSDNNQDGGDSWSCQLSDVSFLIADSILQRLAKLTGAESIHHCGVDGSRCEVARLHVWQDTIKAASAHNSPCQFTTFNGYEWSGGIGANMLHRNVLFGSDAVIASPISRIQAPQAQQLWQALDEQCLPQAGCSAITIPHNSNMSGGNMFRDTLPNGEPLSENVARQRNQYEKLAEIYQHKGSSECFFDPLQSEDELCAFEYLPYSSTVDKYLQAYFPASVAPPTNDSRFMREALREGFRQRRRLGINPFMTGFVASTDTHIAAPGATLEHNYARYHGAQDLSDDGTRVDRTEQGPGGLAVIYAQDNTRQSLFAGMQRRETYGTSGTRIGLRFFGGTALPANLCERSDMLAEAYRSAVPMGGELPAMQSSEQSPDFLVTATRDPLQGAALQRLQIIKGWVDREGVSREQVMDVAGTIDSGASVDLTNCEPRGPGEAKLCALWRDPDFDPSLDAYYYARALENPSCRWTTYACLEKKVDCNTPQKIPESLAHCCDTSVPKTLQERAWSSPIWYQP